MIGVGTLTVRSNESSQYHRIDDVYIDCVTSEERLIHLNKVLLDAKIN